MAHPHTEICFVPPLENSTLIPPTGFSLSEDIDTAPSFILTEYDLDLRILRGCYAGLKSAKKVEKNTRNRPPCTRPSWSVSSWTVWTGGGEPPRWSARRGATELTDTVLQEGTVIRDNGVVLVLVLFFILFRTHFILVRTFSYLSYLFSYCFILCRTFFLLDPTFHTFSNLL